MIAYTAFLLFVIGLFCLIPVDAKKDRFFSGISFIFFLLIFTWFFSHVLDGSVHNFSFIWNSSASGDIKIDIISSPYNYMLVLPFFIITLIGIANNNFFRYEEQRFRYNGILIFNLITIITMITSNNFVQLLAALFLIDIFALFIIKNIDAFRRFAFMNIAADMIIFTILAMINCHVDSLDIGQILLYKRIGHHLNFMTLVGLIAIAVKSGFFMFHIGLLELKNIRLHRIINILFLSSGMSALILLLKFHVLWKDSLFFVSFLQILCISTMIYAFFGSLFSADFKAKIIYFHMMFLAFFIMILYFHGFIWTPIFTLLLIEMFLLNNSLYMTYFYCGRKAKILKCMQTKITNKCGMYSSLLLISITIFALTQNLSSAYNNANRYYIWSFAILFIISLSSLVKQIYFSTLQRTKEAPNLKMRWFPFILTFSLLLICISLQKFRWLPIIGFFCAYLFLCRFSPASNAYKYYENKLQNTDWLGYLYKHICIKPLQFTGRILWIGIDRLLVEKFVLNIINIFADFCLKYFRFLHNNIFWGSFIIFIFLTILLWASFINGDSINV